MADHEHSEPGEPPPVRDEAADSPMWLPALGLALLLLGAVVIVWRGSTAEEETGEAAETTQAEGGADEADEAEHVADQPDAPQ